MLLSSQIAHRGAIALVHIPWQNNEANAALAFVTNITQSWVIGFAAYANIPTDGNPVDWQAYIKARNKVIGDGAGLGKEIILASLSIANEGVDWVVTINDIATADTVREAAIASIGLLPFISNSSIKILKNGSAYFALSSVDRKVVEAVSDAASVLKGGAKKGSKGVSGSGVKYVTTIQQINPTGNQLNCAECSIILDSLLAGQKNLRPASPATRATDYTSGPPS